MKEAWMQAWLPIIAFVLDNKIIMFTKITGSSLVILTSQTVKKFRYFNVLMFSWYPLTSGRVKYSLTGINNMPSDKIQNVTLS